MLDTLDAIADDHPSVFAHLQGTSQHLGRSRLDPGARLQVRSHQALATALADGLGALVHRLLDESEPLDQVAESYERSSRERLLGGAQLG